MCAASWNALFYLSAPILPLLVSLVVGIGGGTGGGGKVLVSDLQPQPSDPWSRSVPTGRKFPEVRTGPPGPQVGRASRKLGMRKQLSEPWATASFPREEAAGLIHRAAPLLSAPVWSHLSSSRRCALCPERLRASEPQSLITLPSSSSPPFVRAPGLSLSLWKAGPGAPFPGRECPLVDGE